MRSSKVSKGWSLLAVLVSVGSAMASDQKVEVPVFNALIPAVGFDDNDSVEAVLTGELPSPCYKLAEASVRRVGDEFRVRQFAWLKRSGACGSGDMIDDPVPFSTEVSFGRLEEGGYRVSFKPDTETAGASRSRKFAVEHARASQIDDFNYASISSASVGDIHFSGMKVDVAMTGVFTSDCARLKEPVEIGKVKDVFVVLPVIELAERGCHAERRALEKTISLGAPAPGQYLVHIRSRNGKAINRVFTVLATPAG